MRVAALRSIARKLVFVDVRPNVFDMVASDSQMGSFAFRSVQWKRRGLDGGFPVADVYLFKNASKWCGGRNVLGD